MQYVIAGVEATLPMAALERALRHEDPSALLDRDRHGALRVATGLARADLLGVLDRLGLAPTAIVSVAEGCCGGCGG